MMAFVPSHTNPCHKHQPSLHIIKTGLTNGIILMQHSQTDKEKMKYRPNKCNTLKRIKFEYVTAITHSMMTNFAVYSVFVAVINH